MIHNNRAGNPAGLPRLRRSWRRMRAGFRRSRANTCRAPHAACRVWISRHSCSHWCKGKVRGADGSIAVLSGSSIPVWFRRRHRHCGRKQQLHYIYGKVSSRLLQRPNAFTSSTSASPSLNTNSILRVSCGLSAWPHSKASSGFSKRLTKTYLHQNSPCWTGTGDSRNWPTARPAEARKTKRERRRLKKMKVNKKGWQMRSLAVLSLGLLWSIGHAL